MDSKIQHGRNLVLPYIDDITFIGTSAAKVNREPERSSGALADVNLHTDKRKDFVAYEAPYKVAIGLAWWKEGVLTVKPSHALRLFRVTTKMVRWKRASVSLMEEIVGLWTYALLLRRPALSILFSTFRFLEESGAVSNTVLRIPEPVFDELFALSDVFPLLSADLRIPLSQKIYFVEACPSGGVSNT